MYAAIPEKAASFIHSQRIFPISRFLKNLWEYGKGRIKIEAEQ